MTSLGHLLHLVAFAQIGVVIRVYLGLVLGGACETLPWVPCITSNGIRYGGAFFTDLPANVVGSFLMGLLVSSDVLSNSLKHTLTVEAPFAVLPTRSPLQTHMPFQVGLRTGLCGSLTTFASWITEMVLMMVGGKPMPLGTQWVEAIAGLLVGVFCAMASLVMGQHVALLIYHKLNPGAFIPYGSPAPEQLKLEQSGSRALPLDPQQPSIIGPQHLRNVSHRSSRTISSVQQGSTTMVVIDASAVPAYIVSADSHNPRIARPGSIELAAAGGPEAAGGGVTYYARISDNMTARHSSQRSSWDASGGAVAGSDLPSPASSNMQHTAQVVVETDEAAGVQRPAAVLATDVFAALSVAVLSGVSLWRIISGNLGTLYNPKEVFAQDYLWWSILLGPFGCYIRFYLSRYNGVLHGSWKWLPLGTLSANIAACVLDFVMKAIAVRVATDSLQAAVLSGVVTGVGGCLSTVSTWVVEIQRLLLSFPNTSHGYQYIFISIVTAVVMGLLIYGIPVWTM